MAEYVSRTTPDETLIETGDGNVQARFPRNRTGDMMHLVLVDGLMDEGHTVWDQNKSAYFPKQD